MMFGLLGRDKRLELLHVFKKSRRDRTSKFYHTRGSFTWLTFGGFLGPVLRLLGTFGLIFKGFGIMSTFFDEWSFSICFIRFWGYLMTSWANFETDEFVLMMKWLPNLRNSPLLIQPLSFYDLIFSSPRCLLMCVFTRISNSKVLLIICMVSNQTICNSVVHKIS